MMKTWAAVCAAVLALVMTGCTNTDIGDPCVLVKKDPTDTDPSDGTRSIPIKWDEIKDRQQQDFISFGATECEDLVCVLSTGHWPSNWSNDLNAAAVGECSTQCSGQGAQGACVTGDNSIDSSPDAFTCRALVLDPEVLAAKRLEDPSFPQSPYFCARPLAGTTN
jgi:hypothetical protein